MRDFENTSMNRSNKLIFFNKFTGYGYIKRDVDVNNYPVTEITRQYYLVNLVTGSLQLIREKVVIQRITHGYSTKSRKIMDNSAILEYCCNIPNITYN